MQKRPASAQAKDRLPMATGGSMQADKGLRHFSALVSAKVEEKGTTTYNEVADELVVEIGKHLGSCDHKNIRRRVYDALNVLMAIDIIRKDKKEIRWLGIPNEAASEAVSLQRAASQAEERIREKRRSYSELVTRLVSLKNLIARNNGHIQGRHGRGGGAIDEEEQSVRALPTDRGRLPTGAAHGDGHGRASDRLHLPFILVNAPRDCRVHCEMLEDRSQYFFEFDSPFLINEDIELLRLMHLDVATEASLLSWMPSEQVAFYFANERAAHQGGGRVHAAAPPPAKRSAPPPAKRLAPTAQQLGAPSTALAGRAVPPTGGATDRMADRPADRMAGRPADRTADGTKSPPPPREGNGSATEGGGSQRTLNNDIDMSALGLDEWDANLYTLDYYLESMPPPGTAVGGLVGLDSITDSPQKAPCRSGAAPPHHDSPLAHANRRMSGRRPLGGGGGGAKGGTMSSPIRRPPSGGGTYGLPPNHRAIGAPSPGRRPRHDGHQEQ